MNKVIVIIVIIVGLAGGLFLAGHTSYERGYLSFLSLSQDMQGEVTLVFGGDVMLSREIGNIMRRNNDYTYFWKDIKSLFADSDIAFVNFENPVSDRGQNVGSIYSFRAEPKSLEGLTYAGIDVASFANNHVWDWGREAFLQSFDLLTQNGIEYVGAGKNFTESHTAKIIERNGVKVAYLGYTNLLPYSLRQVDSVPSVAGIDVGQIEKDIQKARDEGAHIVVTSFHFGEEYETKHNQYQEQIAHAAIDAGADLVIGHHPHVVQEVEKYNNGIIAYSLGNLIFDQNFSVDTSFGQVLRVIADKEGLKKAETIQVDFSSTYVPKVGTIESIL